MHTIFIDGAEGTTGLQIYERLEQDTDIRVLRLEEPVRKSLPHRLGAIAEADLTILCLPDAAAKEIVAAAPPTAAICDASTAHRTAASWAYGFAELHGHRQHIQTGRRVAVPGCHATGFLALARPLVECGAVPAAAQLHCHSLTGYSGGGKKMIAEYEDAARGEKYAAPRQYALGMAHKHLPEMQHVARLCAPPLFCPIVADYYSGMLVSIPLAAAALSKEYNTPEKLRELYREYYAGQPLVWVAAENDTPADGMLCAAAMAGRDDMALYILGNEEHLLLCASFDNLGKGASGAAVQCANLMLGRPETRGLRQGAWPPA